MTDLTDQEYAEVLKLELDRAGLRTDGHAVTDYLRMRISELDPPDPLAGLDDDQWVEVDYPNGSMCSEIARVRRARWAAIQPELIRVVPDGDARDVLVIPVEVARKALEESDATWNPIRYRVVEALAEHEARWSS